MVLRQGASATGLLRTTNPPATNDSVSGSKHVFHSGGRRFAVGVDGEDESATIVAVT
jgi:hypothetical protein